MKISNAFKKIGGTVVAIWGFVKGNDALKEFLTQQIFSFKKAKKTSLDERLADFAVEKATLDNPTDKEVVWEEMARLSKNHRDAMQIWLSQMLLDSAIAWEKRSKKHQARGDGDDLAPWKKGLEEVSFQLKRFLVAPDKVEFLDLSGAFDVIPKTPAERWEELRASPFAEAILQKKENLKEHLKNLSESLGAAGVTGRETAKELGKTADKIGGGLIAVASITGMVLLALFFFLLLLAGVALYFWI